MAKIGEDLTAFFDDIAMVALACDGNKGTRMALARLLNSRQDAMERADRAESELAKLKAEPAAPTAEFDGKEFYQQQWIRCQQMLASIETALNEMTGQETDILTNIAYLAKLKAELHAAVQAAPPVLVTLADIGDSDDD